MLTPRRVAAGAAAALSLAAAGPAAAVATKAAVAAPAPAMPSGSASRLTTDLRHAWQITKGRGVTVAVLSDGVDPHVTGLAGKVTVGPDYVKLRDPRDLDGTLIANAIAGDAASAGNPLGTLGLAPQARIISVRVEADTGEAGSGRFDDDASFPDITASAIRYAVGHGAGVIYVDWLPDTSDSANLESAVRYALARGVVITTLAAVDNACRADLTYPAAIPGVIAAAMVTLPAPFQPLAGATASTAANDSVLVAVPANTMNEIGPGDEPFQVYSVDASPAWIAGTAALIKSAYPGLSPALVARAIALSARDRPAGGYNVTVGFGLIDPYGALIEAGKLVKLTSTAGPAGLDPAARFGSPPEAIDVVHRSAGILAAFAAVTVLGVILLAAGLVLALRRPRPVRRSQHAAL